jgi:tRNA (cmo5U34)-methyltransferase
MSTVDTVMADGKWQFDAEVTDAFDDMLARSISQYEVMRKACFDLACAYRQPKTDIVDLGCSRGEAMTALVDQFGAKPGPDCWHSASTSSPPT